MSGNFKIITSAALVGTLVAFALALMLALQPPTGPGGPSLYDCTIISFLMELFILMNWFACMLYCERRHADNYDAKVICQNNCVRGFIIGQLLVTLFYIGCVLRAVFF